MKRCDNLSVGSNGLDLVECPGTVARWCWWSALCAECRREVRTARARAGMKWWNCPPKPYLRRGFQLLGLIYRLLSMLWPYEAPRLELRAETLRSFGYWMSRDHFERALRGSSGSESGQEPGAGSR